MRNNNGDNFIESNTYRNLLAAFNGEATASTKYAIYGMKAKEDGFEQIGNIYEETSRNEREHAEIWFKLLHGGVIPTTLDNLKDSFGGENYEWTNMYMGYAEEAKKEGYSEIARLFEGVAAIERHHDARFRKLAQNIMYDKVFCKGTPVLWVCLNCGNLFYGECAPDPCPVCGYPQGYYQLNCENY
jgi:rubrerythrin